MKILFLFIIFTLSSSFSKTFLWEVSDNNSKIYLLGSVHVAREDMYPLNNIIENAYKQSDALVLEVVIDKINPMTMMSKMMLSGGKTLKTEMDSVSYLRLTRLMDSLNIPKMTYMNMKPWAATIILMQSLMENEGFSQDLGFDFYFLKKARNEQKEVYGLETFEEQISVFDSIANYSTDFFEYSLTDLQNTKSMVDEMLNAWKNGDTASIDKIINKSVENSEDYQKITEFMLDRRNFKMQAKIEEYLKEDKNYFIVVGAGHLIGENGLLELLSKKYKLKQL